MWKFAFLSQTIPFPLCFLLALAPVRGWTGRPLEVPSNLSQSVVVWGLVLPHLFLKYPTQHLYIDDFYLILFI